jgi:hypothetical protein
VLTVTLELTNPKSIQYEALLKAIFDTGGTHSYAQDSRLSDYTYDNSSDQADELQIMAQWRLGYPS